MRACCARPDSGIMKRPRGMRFRLQPVAVGCLVAAVSGCGGLGASRPMGTGVPIEVANKTYKLRYRREKGSHDRYQATYRMRIRNDYQADEDVSAELVYYCTGKTAGREPFDRVVIRREEKKRKLLEISAKKKVTRKDRPRGARQPVITPNFEAEPGTRGVRYIPFDELGRIAKRRQTPFHFILYDSLCYLFPVFPVGEARLGDRWPYKTAVIVGQEYSNNMFLLHADFHFMDLRKIEYLGGEPLCAVIKYTYYGLLDTDNPADAKKLPKGATGFLWRRYVVEGEGMVYFDLEGGKVLWKREKYTVTTEAKTLAALSREERGKRSRNDKPKIKHTRTVYKMQFSARILSAGERATDRPSRLR